MKFLIGIIIFVMIALIWNIVAYTSSDDYRFFLKKIKYREEVVYENTEKLTDLPEVAVWQEDIKSLKDDVLWRKDIQTNTQWYTFIDVISGNKSIIKEETLPDLTWTQEQFLEIFSEYDLVELQTNTSLFDITTEYPDPYYEWYSEDVSLYMFASKSYSEVLKVFEVLAYELPYTLNEVDNFGQWSAYINLEDAYRDDTVRMLIKHKNKAFWLKIKKDSYNAIKTLLEDNL